MVWKRSSCCPCRFHDSNTHTCTLCAFACFPFTDFPCERTARNLTLVAKVVQNLANMSEFGVKEPFMQPCNRFIISNRNKMQGFLTSLTVRCFPFCFNHTQPASHRMNIASHAHTHTHTHTHTHMTPRPLVTASLPLACAAFRP